LLVRLPALRVHIEQVSQVLVEQERQSEADGHKHQGHTAQERKDQ
jgi:hypothetical protein